MRDTQYAPEIKEVIKNTIEQYAATPYNRQHLQTVPLEEIEFTISDQLFLDVLLMNIRSKTMEFSSKKKKNNNMEESKLEEDIQILEHKINRTELENYRKKMKI